MITLIIFSVQQSFFSFLVQPKSGKIAKHFEHTEHSQLLLHSAEILNARRQQQKTTKNNMYAIVENTMT